MHFARVQFPNNLIILVGMHSDRKENRPKRRFSYGPILDVKGYEEM